MLFFFFFSSCYYALTFRECQGPEKINCFGLGTVKLTNTMVGVRHVGWVFIWGILVYEESGAGPRTAISDPANK